jgi:hypothetical protein
MHHCAVSAILLNEEVRGLHCLLGVVIREVGWAWYAALIGEMTEFI